MNIRNELVFDRESAGASVGSARRARGVLFGSVAMLAIVIIIAVRLLSGPTPREGAQATQAGPMVLERPAVDGWELLVPIAGEQRAGFPPPMVWTVGRVCIGFARLDFGPDDLRPSLARCERQSVEHMAVNEIRSLVSVKSGYDTWHFLEASGQFDSITVRLATGEDVNGDRIHLSGSTAALRLENDRDLASLQWSTRSLTYRCSPDPTAWRTSEFCADRGDEPDD